MATAPSQSSSCGPVGAAAEDGLHLRYGEFLGLVAERRVKDAALAVFALPGNRHDDAVDPIGMIASKGGGGQHLVRRVDMHVILLRRVGEIGDPLHDRVVRARDIDRVVDDVAGMGDPLAADDELILDAFTERVASTAMIAGDADAAFDRGSEVLHLFLLDLRHGDDRHDQAEIVDRGIGEGLGAVFEVDLEAVLFQHVADDMGAFLRFVAAPATPDDKCFTHDIPPEITSLAADLPIHQGFGQRGRTLRLRRDGDRASAVGSRLEGFHDLEHVQREAAIGAVRTVGADGMRHVGDAERAVVAVGIGCGDLALGEFAALLQELHRAAETVRIGHDQRALGAVDFERHMLVAGDIEAHADLDDGTIGKGHDAGDMRRHMHGDVLAVARLAGDDALLARRDGKAGDLRDGAEQVDEIGDVIGTHIEHRAAADFVIESRIRMPALMAGAHEGGGAADRDADRAFVNDGAGRLVAAAEEGIGCRADAQALGGSGIRKPLAFGEIDAERLFRVGVFAGFQCLKTDGDMRLRDGQVDDDLDRGIGKQGGDIDRLQAEFGSFCLGELAIEVGHAFDVENGKGFHGGEIGAGNVPAADNADADLVHRLPPDDLSLLSWSSSAFHVGAEPLYPLVSTQFRTENRCALFLELLWGSERRRRSRRSPRRFVEFAQRDDRGALRPGLVGRLVEHQFGHALDRWRDGQRIGLPQAVEEGLSECKARSHQNDARRGKQRDDIGERHAAGFAGADGRADQRVVLGVNQRLRMGHAAAEADGFGEAAARLVAENGALTGKACQSDRALRTDAEDQIAEIVAEAAGAAKKLAAMQHTEPQRLLQRHQHHVVQVSGPAEPVMCERDGVGVAFDDGGDAQPLRHFLGEIDAAFAEDRAGADMAGAMLDDAGQAEADGIDLVQREIGIDDAAAHTILDKIGNDTDRLPVDAQRQRQRRENLAAEVRDDEDHAVGGDFRADDARGIGIKLQHDAGPAAGRRLTQVAFGAGQDQPVIQQRGCDCRNCRGRQLGAFADFDTCDGARPPDGIQHIEAVYRPHKLGICCFHEIGAE
ncbi:hypothetical protein RHSP_78414 [Rhizobium freirei PRF 81]|uniref:Uncharacterized protein n=1 Tax=Rhizobium freirei PRF 81 TaxID=363754 RepID=N6U1A6_9HYPH|nr:hypothetical protein RHSP_78414 [Rhizobium freirei PRF 81]